MSRIHLYVLSAVLAITGAAFAAYKVVFLEFPLLPTTRSEIWRAEVQVTFVARGGPAKVTLRVPSATGPMTVIDQGYTGLGYGVTAARTGANRQATYTIRSAKGKQYLYYRVVVDLRRTASGFAGTVPAPRAPEFRPDEMVAAKTIIEQVRTQSADARTFAELIVKRLNDRTPSEAVGYLLSPNPPPQRLAAVAVDLLLLAGTPARVVNGLPLDPERRHARFIHWIEVHDGKQWIPVYLSELSRDSQSTLLPWWRGRGPLVDVEGGNAVKYDVTTSRSYELAARAAIAQQRAEERRLVEFSLFGLPLQSQSLFRTVLTIPLGVLLLVIMRNVVGFTTFGTFMPVLIALAFRQTGLAAGIVFFTIVLAAGLGARLYLERLKLLLVPRLAAVLIFVVILIAALTIVSHRLGLDVGLSIGLFPIVILTMTIERMTIIWEERGPGDAMQQAAGSLFVAALTYLLINRDDVQHLFFVFPELLLVLLAVTLLLGRYTGYRLLELYRFRALVK